MKILNNLAKINLKILSLALIIYSLFIVPRVLAVTFDRVMTANPYAGYVIIFSVASGIMRLVRCQYSFIKRIMDLVISTIGLLVFAPLIIVFGILIKLLSPKGPVLYSQDRVGMNGEIFRIYKLRSMHADAEKLTGAVWANENNDPRVIPFIGKFLRKSHIDEIPQFFNVLNGEMSVIGPRPERPEIVNDLKSKVFEYDKRLGVRPGITGLAQIRNRYDKTLNDVRRKVKLDLLYMRKICLVGELRILFLTLIVVVKGKVIG